MILTSTGCSYLEARGRDFADCFKASAGIGLGAATHVRVGPIGVGTGLWSGYSVGLERNREVGYWEEHDVGFPFSIVGAYLLLGNAGASTRSSKSPVNSLYFLSSYSTALSWPCRGPAGDYLNEGDVAFWLWTVGHNWDGVVDQKWIDYFWIEVSLRAIIGVKAGFNIAEFADFILGWFGIDLCEDDERGGEEKGQE